MRLYPPAWRRRYTDEFMAHLNQEQLKPRDILDLLRGALDANLHPQLSAGPRARLLPSALAVVATATSAWVLWIGEARLVGGDRVLVPYVGTATLLMAGGLAALASARRPNRWLAWFLALVVLRVLVDMIVSPWGNLAPQVLVVFGPSILAIALVVTGLHHIAWCGFSAMVLRRRWPLAASVGLALVVEAAIAGWLRFPREDGSPYWPGLLAIICWAWLLSSAAESSTREAGRGVSVPGAPPENLGPDLNTRADVAQG